MGQLDLFDNPKPAKAPAIARRTDPVTSHKAAAEMAPKLRGLKKLFYETLKKWGNIPRTANEVAARVYQYHSGETFENVGAKRESLRKRAGELVKAGLIRECGDRPCRVNGKQATTYEVI